jgi:hypothetical protein
VRIHDSGTRHLTISYVITVCQLDIANKAAAVIDSRVNVTRRDVTWASDVIPKADARQAKQKRYQPLDKVCASNRLEAPVCV